MGEGELITEVGPHDVLFGRGSGPNSHDGNIRFRALVSQRKEEYLRTNHRQTKVKIAGEIVETVLANGGRFLKRVNINTNSDDADKDQKGPEVWQAVDHDTMMEKAKQALRQNLERNGVRDDRRPSMTSPGMMRMSQSPRVVTPNGLNPADFEPNPIPTMGQYGGGYSQQPTTQSSALTELTGNMEITNLIQNMVNVRKDEYFAANDPQSKAAIAKSIVDAALAESNRARQNDLAATSTYDLLLQQQQQINSLQAAALQNQGFTTTNQSFNQTPTNMSSTAGGGGGGGGGFNLYTMSGSRPRTSSGTNQFNSMPPPSSQVGSSTADVTISSNYAFDRPVHQTSKTERVSKKDELPDGFNLIGGFPAAAAAGTSSKSSKSRSSKNHKDKTKHAAQDEQSLDEYQMMLEQYINNNLNDSQASLDANTQDLMAGFTDQDSIGTFNQSASELESMAETVSMMSYTSKPTGGIDSYLSANHKDNKRSRSSALSRGSRRSKGSNLKAHFMNQDNLKTKKSSKSGGASIKSVKDDMSLSGMSTFSGMTNNTDGGLSLMSGMTDLSEALDSLDLAGDYSQLSK